MKQLIVGVIEDKHVPIAIIDDHYVSSIKIDTQTMDSKMRKSYFTEILIERVEKFEVMQK